MSMPILKTTELHPHRSSWFHRCPTCQKVVRWQLLFCVLCAAERMLVGKRNPAVDRA